MNQQQWNDLAAEVRRVPATVRYARTLTEQQRLRLTELSVWNSVSFPNGSAYRRQSLPAGDHGDVVIVVAYNDGYYCSFVDEPGVTRRVRFGEVSVGPGTDLGIHFCSRDQAMAALLPQT